MIRTDKNYSEVFEIFAEIAEQEKLMERPADFVLPEGLTESAGSAELQIPLAAMAASDRNKLYGVTNETGEQLVGEAHPGGGTKLDFDPKPEKDYGKVETIVEQHKTNQGIALKMPTGKLASLTEKLMVLANAMDDAGLTEQADEVSEMLSRVAALVDFQKEADYGGFNDGAAADDGNTDDLSQFKANLQELKGRMDAESPETQALQHEQIAKMKAEQANKAQRIKEMNAKALQAVNKHLQAAGLDPMPSMSTEDYAAMGISGYKTWQELFNQIEEKAPAYAANRKANNAPVAQPAPAAPANRGAAENLAAAEKNHART